MSKPAAGNYYIINRVLSPSGDRLAITSNGQGQLLTVTPMASLPSQQWAVVDYSDGKNQSVSPTGNTSLQAIYNSQAIMNLAPSHGYVYWIRGGDGVPYTFHGGNNGLGNWALTTATKDANVTWVVTSDYMEWVFQPV